MTRCDACGAELGGATRCLACLSRYGTVSASSLPARRLLADGETTCSERGCRRIAEVYVRGRDLCHGCGLGAVNRRVGRERRAA